MCVCVFLVHFLKENWNIYYCNEPQTIKECCRIDKNGTVNNRSQHALLQRLARILKIWDVRIAIIVLNRVINILAIFWLSIAKVIF